MNFKKLNKAGLKTYIKQYRSDLEKELAWVKHFKMSKLKKAELVEICEQINDKNMDNNNIEYEKKEEEKEKESEV